MPDRQSMGALNGAIADILKLARQRGKTPSLRDAEDLHCSGRATLDYAAGVRRHFDRAQLRQMLKEMRNTLPTLNREVYSVTEVDRLARQAADLGVTLQAHAFRAPMRPDCAAFTSMRPRS